MTTPAEPLTTRYDAHNDVLRVLTTAEPEPAIAVPGNGVTMLVSEDRERVVGLVFERYRPVVLERVPEALQNAPEEALLEYSMAVLEHVLPPLLASCAPAAQQQIAEWLESAPDGAR